MDEATQQNSALVEENAAAAKALEHQSRAMDEQVSFFRLDDGHVSAQAPVKRDVVKATPAKPIAAAKRPAADAAIHRAADGTNGKAPPKTPPKRGVVGRMQTAIATAFKPDWKEF